MIGFLPVSDQLRTSDVLRILSVHPRLPSALDPPTFRRTKARYLRRRGFLEGLPCAAVYAHANDFEFLESRLSSADLKVRPSRGLHCWHSGR